MEFGIFGGEAGAYVLDLVEALEKPLVTTFHTVFAEPEEPYKSIQQKICDLSDRILVMNREAAGYLNRAFGVPEEKVLFVPHGTPVPRPEWRNMWRKRMGWEDRKVIMTFGLLSRGKGIESVLQALVSTVREVRMSCTQSSDRRIRR